MRQKYSAQWYKTLSFTQNNTLYSARGGATNSQWREHIVGAGTPAHRLPAALAAERRPVRRIACAHVRQRSRDRRAGRASTRSCSSRRTCTRIPLERSTQLLDSLGFDLTKLRRDTWEGQSAYVVGAAAGDSTTSQFWIDAEKLVALRVVQKERRGTRDIVTDVRFGKFADFGGVPIATEVTQYRDGRLVFREQYVDVRVNDPIPDATFDPTKWVAAQPKSTPAAES